MNKQNDELKLGPKIKALMSLSSLTPTSLHEDGGINRATLSRFLNGKSEVRSDLLLRVLDHVGINLDSLINKKISEHIGTSKESQQIGAELEYVLSHLDRLTAKTLLEGFITKAKKQSKADLKKEIKKLESYKNQLTTAGR